MMVLRFANRLWRSRNYPALYEKYRPLYLVRAPVSLHWCPFLHTLCILRAMVFHPACRSSLHLLGLPVDSYRLLSCLAVCCPQIIYYLSMLGCLNSFHLVSGFRRFSRYIFVMGVGLSASHPTPSLEDQSIPFSLGHHLDLSGMGGPTSSNATASIALRIIWPRKPHHYVKVGIPSVGGY